MGTAKRIALIALFALLAFFMVFYGLVLFEPGKKRAAEVLPSQPTDATLGSPVVTFIDPKRGNPQGKISIVEFSDYECVYCREVEPILNAALRKYPQLQLVWKDLPNQTQHLQSLPAAIAARCAGRQGKFWEYHDALFTNQEWLSADLYPQLAERLGLNVTKFQACIDGGEETALVKRNVDEAIALGIDATPYFFIGETRISGAVKPAELAAILDRLQAEIQ